MARKSKGYWEERSTKLMLRQEKGTEKTIDNLIEIYNQSTRNINKEINKIFQNYAQDTGLSKQTLIGLLNKKETDTYYKNLLNTINNIKDEGIRKKLLAKYNAPAYLYRISRYQALQDNIDVEISKLADIEQTITKQRYIDTIKEGYYHNIYDIQKGLGIGFNFSQVDMQTINLMLTKKWIANGNYSTRIWNNSNRLSNYLKINFTADTMIGKSVQKIANELSETMNVGLYNATRLVRTEVNHFANEAEMLSYEECGIEKYKFIATLDNVTCEHCAELDNKVFNVKDRKAGKNYPPIHANDRCTTVAVFEDDTIENLQRRARDENGNPILVSQDMNYKKWYDNYVTNSNKHDIITSSNLLEILNIKPEDYVPFGKYDPFENDIQEKASKLLGYDKKINKLSKEEYDKINSNEIIRVVSGRRGKTANEIYYNTIDGNIQYSDNTNSGYGRGIYFGDILIKENIIDDYAKEDSRVITAKLSENANILKFDDQMQYCKAVVERLNKVPKDLQEVYQKETSLLFMIDKIDGIMIKSNNYYCIYNRGVLNIYE